MSFPNLSRRIAKLYTWLGLVSILVLTVVTSISVANVFTRGQLASWPGLQFWWAVIFAAAIEVNIIRLFFDATYSNDAYAKRLGIGLVIVAGMALLIEGWQQSIGFDWGNSRLQVVIGFVVFLRVFVVVLLLAREGSRLGAMARVAMTNDTPTDTIAPVQVDVTPIAPEVAPQLRIMPPKKRGKVAQTLDDKIADMLRRKPDMTDGQLADTLEVSLRTVQRHKPRIAKEA